MSRDRFVGRIGHLLVVEDNAILAMDMEFTLADLGVERVTLVMTADDAIGVLGGGGIDAALVDVALGQGSGSDVAKVLRTCEIPFALVTGYGDMAALNAAFPGISVLSKPFGRDELVAILNQLC